LGSGFLLTVEGYESASEEREMQTNVATFDRRGGNSYETNNDFGGGDVSSPVFSVGFRTNAQN
jgi:hypothetical protein